MPHAQMMNMTVYEDSDPANLAIEAGKMYSLPPNQQGQLKVAIESQILQRVKLRIPIDMTANGIGKQLLMTRGALTTFSIANDVAKYFAIIPAMFLTLYPQLQALNVMGLASPQSAILSAIIFNALIIVALIPLALRGVTYRAVGAAALLRRNLLIYGLGGVLVPFVGIKAIDLAVSALHLA